MRAQSAQVDIPRQRLNEFDQEQVRNYLDALADQFAEGMTKHMFEAISKAAEKVGNVVDGKRLTADT
jgi:hypothetical protein